MPHNSSPESDTLHRRGLMFILSSPSGAGKTTLSRMLLAADEEIALSVSATTRPPRDGEVDGKDYHFVSDKEFDRLGIILDLVHTADTAVRQAMDRLHILIL